MANGQVTANQNSRFIQNAVEISRFNAQQAQLAAAEAAQSAIAASAATAQIAAGTATPAGPITGQEAVSFSQKGNLVQSAWNAVATFFQTVFTSAIIGTVGAARTLFARLSDDEVSLNEFYLATYTDDQAKNAAFAWCATNGKNLVIPYRNTAYVWTTTAVWNNHAHGVRCESGVQINASGITGYALNVAAPFSDVYGTQQAYKNVWRGGTLYGTRTTGQSGILFGDGVSNVLTGGNANIQDMCLHDFDNGIGYGNNSFQIRFSGVIIYNCNIIEYCPPGLANSGENISHISCQLLNSTQMAVLHGGWFNYVTCSFDYFTQTAISCFTGAQVSIIGGHTESNSDSDYWYKTQDSQSKINISDGHVLYVTNTVNKTLPFFNGGNADGGIFIDNIEVATNRSLSTQWYQPSTLGVGFCYITSVSTTAPTSTPYNFKRLALSPTQNLFADGGFEDVNLSWRRVDWHLNNTNSADVGFDTTVFHSGTQSLKIAPATGRQVTMICTRPCGPGSWPQLTGYFQAANLQAGDGIFITAQFFDAAGVNTEAQIPGASNTFNWINTTAPSAWTQFNWSAGLPAPAGTAYVQLNIVTLASVNGLATYWFDDMNLTIPNASLPAASFVGRSFTFTPVVSGQSTLGIGTYSTQQGRAEIHGGRVEFNIQLTWTAHTGNGGIAISGLPFECDFNLACAVSLRLVGIPFTGPIVQAFVGPGTNSIVINQLSTAGVESQIGLPSSGTIEITGSYQKI